MSTPPTSFFRFSVFKWVRKKIHFDAPTTKLKPKVVRKEKKKRKMPKQKCLLLHLFFSIVKIKTRMISGTQNISNTILT